MIFNVLPKKFVVWISVVAVIVCAVFFVIYLIKDKNTQTRTETDVKTERYISKLGVSFNLPKDMVAVEGLDLPEPSPFVGIIFDQKEDDNTERGIIISMSENKPGQTPLKWLNSPNSGADMSKGYEVISIDGQEAISLNNGSWVVFDTPEKEIQVSIATLPSTNPDQLLLSRMKDIVASFKFEFVVE